MFLVSLVHVEENEFGVFDRINGFHARGSSGASWIVSEGGAELHSELTTFPVDISDHLDLLIGELASFDHLIILVISLWVNGLPSNFDSIKGLVVKEGIVID